MEGYCSEVPGWFCRPLNWPLPKQRCVNRLQNQLNLIWLAVSVYQLVSHTLILNIPILFWFQFCTVKADETRWGEIRKFPGLPLQLIMAARAEGRVCLLFCLLVSFWRLSAVTLCSLAFALTSPSFSPLHAEDVTRLQFLFIPASLPAFFTELLHHIHPLSQYLSCSVQFPRTRILCLTSFGLSS